MKTKILNTVLEIADERDVSPIAARSFGSHMMSLDSDRSDYDVFLLFSQPVEAYTQVGGYTDTFEETEDDIDIQAWNIKKFGELLCDSNPTALEFLNSDVEYYRSPQVNGHLDELRKYANENFKPIAAYHHYRSMAHNNYTKYIQPHVYDGEGNSYPILDRDGDDVQVSNNQWRSLDEVTEASLDQVVKRYLYVLRATFYAKHIRRFGEFPDMNFQRFLDECGMNFHEPVVRYAKDLASKKTEGRGLEAIDPQYTGFVEGEFAETYDSPKYDQQIGRERVNEFIKLAVE